MFNQGDTFVIGIIGLDDGPGFKGSATSGSSPCGPGELYLNGRIYSTSLSLDLAFPTCMDATPVPLPAALRLPGSGLLALAGLRRKTGK